MCTLVACVEYVYTAPDCQLAIIVTITHLIHSLWGQRTETVKNALTLLPPPACTPTPSPPPAPVKRRWGDGRGGGGAAHQPGPRVTGGLNLKGWPQCAVLASPPQHTTHPSPVSRRQESAQILLLGARTAVYCHSSLCRHTRGHPGVINLSTPHYHHILASRPKPHLNE